MHVDHAEQARNLGLHSHPILQGAQIVAEMQCVGRLHAGQDQVLVLPWTCFGGGHGGVSKGARLSPVDRHGGKWWTGPWAGLSVPRNPCGIAGMRGFLTPAFGAAVALCVAAPLAPVDARTAC